MSSRGATCEVCGEEYPYSAWEAKNCTHSTMTREEIDQRLEELLKKDAKWNGEKQSRVHMQRWRKTFSRLPESPDELDNFYKVVNNDAR